MWRGFFLRRPLEKDPQEMVSVHENPEYADIFATMKNRYQELLTQFKVPDGLPK
jgi:hypothetical protein